ncbi:MAG: hypothetical protein WCE91_06575, partial [Nitrososphaeraceae archaeon]
SKGNDASRDKKLLALNNSRPILFIVKNYEANETFNIAAGMLFVINRRTHFIADKIRTSRRIQCYDKSN